MRTHLIAVAAAVIVFLGAFTPLALASEKEVTAFDGDYRISGPYTHQNLSIFLIHGRDQLPGKTYLTLQEAMEQGKIIVHDAGEVSIENLSEEDLFIQAYDIVEGGCQDRCFPDDFIVKAGAGRVGVPALCVEQGRSEPRGTEHPREFHTASQAGAGKNFKLAARLTASQDGVWSEVAQNQQKLTQSLGFKVEPEISPSSLPLTLRNEKVAEAADPFMAKLSSIIDRREDVIGYAFAINGKVNSADVYGNAALFRSLWPKLLRSSVIEAIAEHPNANGDQQPIAPPPTREAVKACLEDAATATAEGKLVGDRTVRVTRQTAAVAMFDTLDAGSAADNAIVHRSFITLDPPPAPGEENGSWRRRTR
jgi:hypothetical protein